MSTPKTPRQQMLEAAASKQQAAVPPPADTANPTHVGRRGSLSKSLLHSHDPTVDPITHQPKSAEAVGKPHGKGADAHRVHTPFTQGSAAKSGFDIITGTNNNDKPKNSDSVLSPRRKPESVPPYDPVTNQELKHAPSGDKRVSHGYYKKEMIETHSNVDPITGQKVEPVKPLVSAGSFRKELEANGTNVDPITGNFKSNEPRSPTNAGFKKAAMEQASSPGSPPVAYDPITGKETGLAVRPSTSMGAFRKEMIEQHQNVDPITGARVAAPKAPGQSHGAIKAELLKQGQSGNPIY